MKKIVIISFIISLNYLFSEELNFRGFKFGTEMDKIIEKEGEPNERHTKEDYNLVGDYVIIYHNVPVAGYSVTMQIEFKDNKLIAGTYIFTLEQKELIYGINDPKNYVNAYNDLINKLTKLYKVPKITDKVDNIENETSVLYSKTIIDSAPYYTRWEVYDGAVLLNLKYKNKWTLGLIYISPELYKKMKESKSKKENNTDGL